MSFEDLVTYGISIECDGKRIDPKEFYMTEHFCRTCLWWDQSEADKESNTGTCRWAAPHPEWGQPLMGSTEWCRYWNATPAWEKGNDQP